MTKPVVFFKVGGASLLAIFVGIRFGTKGASKDAPATLGEMRLATKEHILQAHEGRIEINH